jgi:nucleoside-diphosphate-sugar epimerase
VASKIYVAGHRGMVGQAIVRQLLARGADLVTRPRAELDLTDQQAVRIFFEDERPDLVILAAAKVGGIQANSIHPAEFIYANLQIEANVIHQAWRAGVHRLVFLGSSCIYPRTAPQPMREEALLSGPLEPTNEPYAIAKIAGIKLCESYNRQYGTDYRSVMPTNLYGPGDNFHPEHSHVLPALIRRFHEARVAGRGEVTVWGTGAARREFLHVDDMAAATLFVADLPEPSHRAATSPMQSHLNVGWGEDIAIGDLARMIAGIVGFSGRIRFDPSRPDGAPRKLLDTSRLTALGWRPAIALEEGIRQSYEWFLQHRDELREV